MNRDYCAANPHGLKAAVLLTSPPPLSPVFPLAKPISRKGVCGTLRERFELEGLWYEVIADGVGDLVLQLTGGSSRKGRGWRTPEEDLFWDEPDYSDVNLTSNALPVLRKTRAIVLSWIHRTRPWRVGFAASTERKRRIYHRLAQRAARDLTGYVLVEFPLGTFNFYKRHLSI